MLGLSRGCFVYELGQPEMYVPCFAAGTLLMTDLKIYRVHTQPICYRYEMGAILLLPHFSEALTISSGMGTVQHLCLWIP